MRFEGKNELLRLALLLSGSHAGLGIADVQREFCVSHRTAQRMMSAIRDRFPSARKWKRRSEPSAGGCRLWNSVEN